MLGHDTTAGRSRRRDLGPAGRRRPRRIYPGDKIYYYSPAFVVGDTRALREAVVVRIDPDEDAEFPILINSVEILPLRTVLKPILSSDGGELRLQRAVDGAFAAVRAGGNGAGTTDRVIIPEVESENSAEDNHEDNGGNVRDRGMSYDAETGVAAEEKHEANEDQRELVDCFTDSLTRAQNLAAFDKLWTPTFREKKNHRGKDRLGIRKTSRKRGHRKQRKPSRKSQAVYHANTTQSAFLSKFMKLPQVRQALLARRNQEPESDGTGPDVVRTVQGSGQPVYTEVTDVTSSLRVLRAPLHAPKSPNEDPKKNVKWPGDVFEIRGQRNPSGIKFSDIGDLDPTVHWAANVATLLAGLAILACSRQNIVGSEFLPPGRLNVE
ncbi:hypothetical protein PHYPSEUDO_011111 [Phytophthora pseudosyringae]|uniref:Uncharacterized protein n=1 Tax=Phytophthora pseudosyringae TaxID=221518 RepID=A0A8T1WAQ7_9STRA|nr:hypothetical protein PHYPSEUDO_011111 [Phytophthora pseudosyringae]